MPGQNWLAFVFGGITLLFILPVFGVFNHVTLSGFPLNIVWLVGCLGAYVVLAIFWFTHPTTRSAINALDEEELS